MISPEPNDVIIGKGYSIQHHPGNKQYQLLVESVKPLYDSTPKYMKRFQAEFVVNELMHNQTPPGRFLRKDKVSDCWHVLDKEEAIKKAWQALRDKKPRKPKSKLKLHKNGKAKPTGPPIPVTPISDGKQTFFDENKNLRKQDEIMRDDLIDIFELFPGGEVIAHAPVGDFPTGDDPVLGSSLRRSLNRGSFFNRSSFNRASFNRGSIKKLRSSFRQSVSRQSFDMSMDDADLDKELEKCFQQILAEDRELSSSILEADLNRLSMTRQAVRGATRSHTVDEESAPRRVISKGKAVTSKSNGPNFLQALGASIKKAVKRPFTSRSRMQKENLQLKYRIKSMQLLKKAMLRRNAEQIEVAS